MPRRKARRKGGRKGKKKSVYPIQGRPEWDATPASIPAAPTVALPPAREYTHPAQTSSQSWNSPYAGTYYDVILKAAEMRNFSVAGGLSGAMTLPPQRPPRQAAGRKTGTRMQASRGSSMLQNPVADVSTKLEQEAAAARTDKYVDPGEWEPSLGKPYKPPFRSVYSAFGSSTASPRHGADESAWFWFGGNRSAPPSATATALAEKDMFSVPNATAERDDAGSAGPGSEGGRPKTASLRGWKRNQSYAQEYTRSEYRLRKLPPKGRADLARYTRAASAQGSSRRSRFGSSGGLQRRGWPQAAFRPTRETMLNVPTHGVPLAHKPDERAFVPSPQHYDVERAWRSKRLQRARSTPAYTVRRRLKSKREMLVATGHSEPPAPGAQVKVPSFVQDGRKQGKGVVFGHKLDSPRTIARRLGILEGPAPGGEAPRPSFVAENRQQSKGVAWTTPEPSAAVRRYNERLAESHKWRNVKSAGKEDKLGRQGTYMLKDTPYPTPRNEKDPEATSPGMGPPVSFVEEDKREGKGAPLGSSRKPLFNTEDTTPAPGGNVKVPSFAREAKEQRRGVVFGSRLKSRDEVEQRLGIPQTPGVGTYHIETKPVIPLQSGGTDPSLLWGRSGHVKKAFERTTT